MTLCSFHILQKYGSTSDRTMSWKLVKVEETVFSFCLKCSTYFRSDTKIRSFKNKIFKLAN